MANELSGPTEKIEVESKSPHIATENWICSLICSYQIFNQVILCNKHACSTNTSDNITSKVHKT